jgi:hypothetical protein
LYLSDEHVRAFSYTTQLDTRSAADMQLSVYDGVAFVMARTGFDARDRSTVARFATSSWASVNASHTCPICLREDAGAWQLRWKFGVVPPTGRTEGGVRPPYATSSSAGDAAVPEAADSRDAVLGGAERLVVTP